MKTIYLHSDDAPLLKPSVATVGFFDGVHVGHKFLIDHVVDESVRLGVPSMVITFDRHPRQVLHQDYQPELLTSLQAKLQLLEQTGVDIAVVLHFDLAMASLTARDFMQQVLRHKLCVEKIVIGYDNRFGHNRAEGIADYMRYGCEMGMEVEHMPAYLIDGIEVSSSVVRAFIKDGEMRLANRCLGYAYKVEGHVVGGYQEGRKMGFPTANLDVDHADQLIPANGVYAVRAGLNGDSPTMPAMTNIGHRPTFHGHRRTLETYIFNFHEDIYGRELSIEFVERVRSERKFDNVNALVDQLKEDEKRIEEIFNRNNNE